MVSQGTGSSYGSDDSSRGMPGEKTEAVKEVAGQVKEQAGQAAEQVKEQASKVTDKAREQTATRADEQKERAAQGLVGFADALSQVSSSMRDQNPAVANFADTAATKLESFAGSLNDKDISELMNDVEQLARRQPALFIGGAFLAGVFAARFLKSSSGMNSGSGSQGGYGGYSNQSSQGYGDYDTRGYSSQHSQQYGRPAGGSGYGSTYGSTGGSQTGYSEAGRASSGETYSPYRTDLSAGDTTDAGIDRDRGASGSSPSS